ncbi:MAG: glycosyltransferase N-terminal domain-containing protein, partial [Gemmatimonadota bacterium]
MVYELAARLAAPAAALAAPFSPKLRRGLVGRRASLPALVAWAETARDARRPLVWLHAPSVGEALMAQAILTELKQREPAVQSVFTHFSPSAERVAARVGADWSGYLPWDTTANARAALDALAPDCVAFVRTEIWPVLVREAHARDIPVVLVNGVLAPGSSRLRAGARMLLRPAYRRLDAVGVGGAADAATFPALGVDPARITVTGDARFDQVQRRVDALDRDRPLLRLLRDTAVRWLVAGSTWPADEGLLVDALTSPAAASFAASPWRIVFAPHEPTPAHIEALERRLTGAGIAHARLPTGDSPPGSLVALPPTGAIIVDRVGVLADLYAIASVAYVGGGFGSAGLHSVVEPAALGVPVVHGEFGGGAELVP